MLPGWVLPLVKNSNEARINLGPSSLENPEPSAKFTLNPLSLNPESQNPKYCVNPLIPKAAISPAMVCTSPERAELSGTSRQLLENPLGSSGGVQSSNGLLLGDVCFFLFRGL